MTGRATEGEPTKRRTPGGGNDVSKWRGSFVALITPFKNGGVDYSKLRDLVEWHIKSGTCGIVACGTTGESATLKPEEKIEICDIVVKSAKGRVPVLAGVGSNDTSSLVTLARQAKQTGVDGLLSVAPYYNRPTQRGLIAHFTKLAESVDVPIVLYNIPTRTGVSIEPETILALRACGNIVGVKDSVTDLDHVTRVLKLCGTDFLVMSGEDSLVLPMMALGARGVISSTANLVPQDMAALCEACVENRWASARDWHLKMFPLIKALFVETNPVPLKAAMEMVELAPEEVRLPLVELEDVHRESVRQALIAYGLLGSSVKPRHAGSRP